MTVTPEVSREFPRAMSLHADIALTNSAEKELSGTTFRTRHKVFVNGGQFQHITAQRISAAILFHLLHRTKALLHSGDEILESCNDKMHSTKAKRQENNANNVETRERERETKRKQVNTDRGHIQHTLTTSNSVRGAIDHLLHKLLSQSCHILRTQRELPGTIYFIFILTYNITLYITPNKPSPLYLRAVTPQET